MTRGRALAVGLVAGILGVAAADAARRAPAFSPAGDSLARVLLGVGAGWALVAAGIALAGWESDVRGARRTAGVLPGAAGSGSGVAIGRLLAAAGCAWLAGGLATPGARSAPLFTAGLVLAAAAPALIGHAMLVAAGDGLRRPLNRVSALALYVAPAGLLGPLVALTFDSAATGCASCPANLLQVTDAAAAGDALSRWGVRLGLLAVAWSAALVLWRLARASTALRRRTVPLVVPGCAYLLLVAAGLAHSWERGHLGTDAIDRALWAAQATALLAMAVGIALLHVAVRRRRSRLARLVVELSRTQRPGSLRDALAVMLGDPDLELLHARRAADGWIDATGRPRRPSPSTETTPLVRDDEPIALLCHRPGLLGDPRLASEIERTVRLGLEHERLEAELRCRLDDLRRSRADIAAAGETERRGLERDLHDGAQQRLVAFSFALGVARRHAAPERAAALERAQREVHEALEELRELAHGLYPVALADAGLAAAVESLGDRRPELRATGLPEERFPPAAEETAYFAIATLAERCAPAPLTVTAAREAGRLTVDLRTPAAPPIDLVDIEDRVGALGGSLAVTRTDGSGTHARVELPCA